MNVVIHFRSGAPDIHPPVQIICPCGWERNLYEQWTPTARDHAATHGGRVYSIAWDQGEIAAEGWVDPLPEPEPIDLFTAAGVTA